MLGIDLKKVEPKSQFLHHVHAAGPLVPLRPFKPACCVERGALRALRAVCSDEDTQCRVESDSRRDCPSRAVSAGASCVRDNVRGGVARAARVRRLRGRCRLKLVVPSERLMRCVARLPLQLLQRLDRLPRGKGLIPSSE